MNTIYKYAIVSQKGAVLDEVDTREQARAIRREDREMGIKTKIVQSKYVLDTKKIIR